jgi:hypothetical protein
MSHAFRSSFASGLPVEALKKLSANQEMMELMQNPKLQVIAPIMESAHR